MEDCKGKALLRIISQSYEGKIIIIQSLNIKGKMNEHEKNIENKGEFGQGNKLVEAKKKAQQGKKLK